MSFFRDLKKRVINEKRGDTSIIFFIKMIFLILLFAVTLDLILISLQHVQVSRMTNNIARQIAIQSGVEASAPKGFPGSEEAYLSTGEVIDGLNKFTAKKHLFNYSLTVNGVNVGEVSHITVKKGEALTVTFTAYYDWYMTKIFVKNLVDKRIVSTKIVFGEFDHDLGGSV